MSRFFLPEGAQDGEIAINLDLVQYVLKRSQDYSFAIEFIFKQPKTLAGTDGESVLIRYRNFEARDTDFDRAIMTDGATK